MVPDLVWRRVRQELKHPSLAEPVSEMTEKLEPLRAQIKPGSSVAVAVGSRNISRIDDIVAALVEFLIHSGARPFVVPAMGSHGGGTPDDQTAILRGLGIYPESIGAPVVSKEEVVFSGLAPDGIEIWVDKFAWEADYIVPVNRVKAHTAFSGAIESGPSKLLSVGLGKQKSAQILHKSNISKSIPKVAKALLETGRIPFGIALVENGRGETALVEVLERNSWADVEARLLVFSKTLLPKLPLNYIDLLVVERMGKDISGTGMDLNVIGAGRRFPEMASFPKVDKLVVLDLTEGSAGNATGIGYADYTTKSMVDKVNWNITGMNCQIAGFPEAARRPIIKEDEDAAIKAALKALDPGRLRDLKAVRIADTAHLEEFFVAESMLKNIPDGLFD